MYKFPQDFDPDVFVGHALQMICFNANQIYFHFDDAPTICAEASFFFERPAEEIATIPVPSIQSDLMQLLEHVVSHALVTDGDILTVIFDNECALRFVPIPGYESYQVTSGEKTIYI